jgi:hypothetical protein
MASGWQVDQKVTRTCEPALPEFVSSCMETANLDKMLAPIGARLPCIGCGALTPAGDGLPHPYLGASPGCWAIYGEVLAREYGDYGYPPVHRLTVDAYSVQHPGTASRRSIQSVAVHLVSLYLVLERGFSSEKVTAAMRQALCHRQQFVWLDPPSSLGLMSILDVRNTVDLHEHEKVVKRWANSVWRAWLPHHEKVRGWAGL